MPPRRLAELALLVGLGSTDEDPGQLAHKFIGAVRNLRTEVGIPDHSDTLRREGFEDIASLAIAEGPPSEMAPHHHHFRIVGVMAGAKAQVLAQA